MGAQAFVSSAGQRPMLSSKSCDGTPITVVHRQTRHQPTGKAVRSQGKQCVEFLVQNQFLRCDMGPDGWQSRVLLAEPTPLWRGKSVPAILSAARRDWRTLRSLGHCGCAVEHYCWDRAGITALDRDTRKWHLVQPLPPLPMHIAPEVARLTEFVVVTACALHDAQNAFKWALWKQFVEKELTRDIYIGIESLRKSADLLPFHNCYFGSRK